MSNNTGPAVRVGKNSVRLYISRMGYRVLHGYKFTVMRGYMMYRVALMF